MFHLELQEKASITWRLDWLSSQNLVIMECRQVKYQHLNEYQLPS